MSTATLTGERIPTGTWTSDHAHSSASFAVQHAGLALFRGGFKELDAKLVVDDDASVLTGTVSVDSIDVEDENIRPHLLAPDFFDVARNPEVRFRSSRLEIDGDEVTIAGELEMAGSSREVEATGRLLGPIEIPGAATKVALALETVIDRTEFGMDWQMELPAGGPVLANEITLTVELELNRE
jgi:polyisoprenoid-binding protein YceI